MGDGVKMMQTRFTMGRWRQEAISYLISTWFIDVVRTCIRMMKFINWEIFYTAELLHFDNSSHSPQIGEIINS